MVITQAGRLESVQQDSVMFPKQLRMTVTHTRSIQAFCIRIRLVSTCKPGKPDSW